MEFMLRHRTEARDVLESIYCRFSEGFDLMGLFYDIASYVQRLAGGANPSDMPIEQSPRFYMAVNLKTAASLGVSLPDVFIARANEVRE
jgi:putative ABC transport system substrate-binding protein